MKIYVGNIPFSATEESLSAEFGAFGEVEDIALITDRETGRPRGFVFVTMADDTQAREAIEKLNGQEVGGRTITVIVARPREGGAGGGGGGYRGGGGCGRCGRGGG